MTTTTTTSRSFIVAGNKAKTARGIVLAVAVSIIAARVAAAHLRDAWKLLAYCIGEGKRIADRKREEG